MSTHAEVAERVCKDFQRSLLDALPRLVGAIDEGQAEASFSVTLQLKQLKKPDRLSMELKPRERIPLPPIPYEVHIDSGQLGFGWPEPEPEGEPGDEGPGRPARRRRE